LNEISGRLETYVQEDYVYSYIRSPHSYGKECSVITFPMSYAPSVTYGLTFINMWQHYQPNWLAKDLIVLFYDEADS